MTITQMDSAAWDRQQAIRRGMREILAKAATDAGRAVRRTIDECQPEQVIRSHEARRDAYEAIVLTVDLLVTGARTCNDPIQDDEREWLGLTDADVAALPGTEWEAAAAQVVRIVERVIR